MDRAYSTLLTLILAFWAVYLINKPSSVSSPIPDEPSPVSYELSPQGHDKISGDIKFDTVYENNTGSRIEYKFEYLDGKGTIKVNDGAFKLSRNNTAPGERYYVRISSVRLNDFYEKKEKDGYYYYEPLHPSDSPLSREEKLDVPILKELPHVVSKDSPDYIYVFDGVVEFTLPNMTLTVYHSKIGITMEFDNTNGEHDNSGIRISEKSERFYANRESGKKNGDGKGVYYLAQVYKSTHLSTMISK